MNQECLQIWAGSLAKIVTNWIQNRGAFDLKNGCSQRRGDALDDALRGACVHAKQGPASGFRFPSVP